MGFYEKTSQLCDFLCYKKTAEIFQFLVINL